MDTWEDNVLWNDEKAQGGKTGFRKNDQSYPNKQKQKLNLPQHNTQLDGGDWLDSILWEDYPTQCNQSAKLTLDMNDPNMIFDVASTDFTTEQIERQPWKNHMQQISKRARSKAHKKMKIDRFNISNDRFYDINRDGSDQRVRQTYGQLVVQHSLPALKLQIPYFKTKLTKSECRAFHRLSLQFTPDQEICFSKVKSTKKNKIKKNKANEAMRSSKELTLKDNSNFILLEYSEEFPPLMSNVGMGSLLLNYYRKTDPNDTAVPNLNIGEPVILDVADASPFMNFGNVEPGQILPALFNNLVRAPLFEHTSKKSDFLVIRNTYKGKTKYYVREINNLFVVGQTFPLQEVPGPHSRKITTTVKNRLQVAALRLMKKSPHHRLKLSRLAKQFPEYNEMQIRQRLKEFAEFQRTGVNKGFWKSKSKSLPSEEELRNMLTPEMICLYESSLVGSRHLEDAGYGKSANGEDEGDESKLSIEAQLAPWFTTRNFLNATQGKAMLKLHGAGDPTGFDEGFSFIRVSMKDIFWKVGESAEEQKERAREAEALKSGQKSSGHKYSVAEQQQRYREEIDRIWNAQYNSLRNTQEPPDMVEDDIHEKHRRHHITGETGQFDYNEDNVYSSASSPSSLFPPGDMDDTYSVDGSMGSRASYAYGSHRNRKLVITRKIRLSNGEEVVQSEDITDPAVINAYMKTREKIEEQSTSAELLEPTDNEEKNRRLRKRIQNELVKLKRNQERRLQRAAAKQAEAAAKASTGSQERKPDAVRRCGNCGELGHMKTNRKCPKFREMNPDIAFPDPAPKDNNNNNNRAEQQPVIKAERTKISII